MRACGAWERRCVSSTWRGSPPALAPASSKIPRVRGFCSVPYCRRESGAPLPQPPTGQPARTPPPSRRATGPGLGCLPSSWVLARAGGLRACAMVGAFGGRSKALLVLIRLLELRAGEYGRGEVRCVPARKSRALDRARPRRRAAPWSPRASLPAFLDCLRASTPSHPFVLTWRREMPTRPHIPQTQKQTDCQEPSPANQCAPVAKHAMARSSKPAALKSLLGPPHSMWILRASRRAFTLHRVGEERGLRSSIHSWRNQLSSLLSLSGLLARSTPILLQQVPNRVCRSRRRKRARGGGGGV